MDGTQHLNPLIPRHSLTSVLYPTGPAPETALPHSDTDFGTGAAANAMPNPWDSHRASAPTPPPRRSSRLSSGSAAGAYHARCSPLSRTRALHRFLSVVTATNLQVKTRRPTASHPGHSSPPHRPLFPASRLPRSTQTPRLRPSPAQFPKYVISCCNAQPQLRALVSSSPRRRQHTPPLLEPLHSRRLHQPNATCPLPQRNHCPKTLPPP
jgi:hypothetical protein